MAKYAPNSSTGLGSLSAFITMTPFLLDPPASPVVVLNYSGVTVFEVNAMMQMIYYPKRMLKSQGLPFQHYPGITPSDQPVIRYGVTGGTSTTNYGSLYLTFVVRMLMLTGQQ
jgi:hypothetical protein